MAKGLDSRSTFDLDALDDAEPFEVDEQAAHLFKYPHLGLDDAMDVWSSDPLFYPAKPAAHWLMLAEVSGVFGPRRNLQKGP